jgi:bifunctional non-homologous end joining protein LigD
MPLIWRKDFLEEILSRAKTKPDLGFRKLRYSEHFAESGDELFKAVCAKDLEGVVSKRIDWPYISGRHDDWRKSKCHQRQEFVIGGYTEPAGSRVGFGSLLLGVYEHEKLRYAGQVGTGFSDATLRDLLKKLKDRESDKSPFLLGGPKRRSGIHWVEPKLVAEVSFAEWTKDKHLRAPVFKGLRADKGSQEIHVEKPYRLTHPDRLVYRQERITKRQVADYYRAIEPWILPHIKDRPLGLVRCMNSSTQTCFFSRHFSQYPPDPVIPVPHKEKEPYVAVDSLEGILALIQNGALEIHTWNCHRQDMAHPDQIVMDIDPDPKVDFRYVRDAALELKEIFAQLKLKCFLKATGGKGLHVQLPLQPRHGWDAIKEFCKEIAQTMAQRNPNRYTSNMSKKVRKGKIFIDYLRNGDGAMAIAPYSLRAKKISSVAMPLAWEELENLKSANAFSMPEALEALETRTKDPWEGYLSLRQSLFADADAP